MDKRTLTALQGSIAKWEAIVWGGGIDRGPYNCPLCKMFYTSDCDGCPVRRRTDQPYCRSTPYVAFMDEFADAVEFYPEVEDYAFVIDEATHDAAKDELAFLKSLLP